MSWLANLIGVPSWPLAFVLGYPLATIAALEMARATGERSPFMAGLLRQAAIVLLPTGAIWLILRSLAGLSPENVAVRAAETAFALTALSIVLRTAQSILLAAVDDDTRAPKLLVDILRIGLALLWGAVVISKIWHVDLGSLIAAMGVGSIVLGFALQEFLGNLLSGLGLLSAHQFGIGDWIVADGRPARVVQMDWRTVTLIDANGAHIVVANSTLAKGNLVVAARANDTAWASIPLTFAVQTPPEAVRAAVQEAAATVPDLVPGAAARCRVTGITEDGIGYMIALPVANPSILAVPRDEFLSRLWYVAQRRGLRLQGGGDGTIPEAERRRVLEQAGAFRGEAAALDAIAAASVFRLFRRGDVLVESGAAADSIFVVAGTVAVSVATAEGQKRLETLGPGRMLVLSETLSGAPSPVRAVAETEVDALAIPSAALAEASACSSRLAHDIGALTESRRQALAALTRGLRRVA